MAYLHYTVFLYRNALVPFTSFVKGTKGKFFTIIYRTDVKGRRNILVS